MSVCHALTSRSLRASRAGIVAIVIATLAGCVTPAQSTAPDPSTGAATSSASAGCASGPPDPAAMEAAIASLPPAMSAGVRYDAGLKSLTLSGSGATPAQVDGVAAALAPALTCRTVNLQITLPDLVPVLPRLGLAGATVTFSLLSASGWTTEDTAHGLAALTELPFIDTLTVTASTPSMDVVAFTAWVSALPSLPGVSTLTMTWPESAVGSPPARNFPMAQVAAKFPKLSRLDWLVYPNDTWEPKDFGAFTSLLTLNVGTNSSADGLDLTTATDAMIQRVIDSAMATKNHYVNGVDVTAYNHATLMRALRRPRGTLVVEVPETAAPVPGQIQQAQDARDLAAMAADVLGKKWKSGGTTTKIAGPTVILGTVSPSDITEITKIVDRATQATLDSGSDPSALDVLSIVAGAFGKSWETEKPWIGARQTFAASKLCKTVAGCASVVQILRRPGAPTGQKYTDGSKGRFGLTYVKIWDLKKKMVFTSPVVATWAPSSLIENRPGDNPTWQTGPIDPAAGYAWIKKHIT